MDKIAGAARRADGGRAHVVLGACYCIGNAKIAIMLCFNGISGGADAGLRQPVEVER